MEVVGNVIKLNNGNYKNKMLNKNKNNLLKQKWIMNSYKRNILDKQ